MLSRAARRCGFPPMFCVCDTRYTGGSTQIFLHETERHKLAETPGNGTAENDKLYKAEYVGSGTFLISKPKRKKTKQRQSNLKNLRRGSRK
jgi:hypothetical protein